MCWSGALGGSRLAHATAPGAAAGAHIDSVRGAAGEAAEAMAAV